MTCQCTCGKHILLDISNQVIRRVPESDAAAAVNYPSLPVQGNTAAFQSAQVIDVVPNTAGAGPTMPNFSVRIEP